MIELNWDDAALAQSRAFLDFGNEWEYFLEHTASDLSKYAQDYFKPMLESVRPNPKGNGDTARSIRENITKTGDGFEINYTGLMSAYYMDVGNFPATSQIYRTNKKPFPVDKRFGDPVLATAIHGMGYYTRGVPNHWSEETVKHMDNDGIAFEIFDKWMNVFLDEVVVSK